MIKKQSLEAIGNKIKSADNDLKIMEAEFGVYIDPDLEAVFDKKDFKKFCRKKIKFIKMIRVKLMAIEKDVLTLNNSK